MTSDSRVTALERLDLAAAAAIEPAAHIPTVRTLAALGKLGDQPPLLALSAMVLGVGWWRGDPRLRRAGADMLAAHLIATAMKSVGKDTIDRTRPHHVMQGGGYRMRGGSSRDKALRSFPSGHTAGAVAVARAVARAYPEHRVAAFGAAAAIGALQLPRRAHFATDVIAGAVLGLLAEGVSHRLIAGWRRLRRAGG